MAEENYGFKLWSLGVGKIIAAISPTTVKPCETLSHQLPSATASQN